MRSADGAARLCALGAAGVLLLASVEAAAAQRYALVVTGASGGAEYAAKYDGWREAFVATLRGDLAYPDGHVLVLAETEGAGIRRATRENVRTALADLARRATKDDVVLVLLIGHGNAVDEEEGKFNLVGPDLSADEWAALLKPVAGRLVFVNAASGSYPFIQKVAGPARVVITANDSAAQQFETAFPGYFIAAFDDNGADLDKDGRVSILEAFRYASAGVKTWFESRGRLATERALLDDTGDGIGREAVADEPTPGGEDAKAADGKVAQVTFLAPGAVMPATTDPAIAELLQQRGEVEARINALKAGKAQLGDAEYERQLEALLLELARLDRAIRSRAR